MNNPRAVIGTNSWGSAAYEKIIRGSVVDNDTLKEVMKKFFVKKAFRSQKIGLALYNELLKYAVSKDVYNIILDTPAVAYASHRFYEKAGFYRIGTAELPVTYSYPDRDSILYLLKL